MHRHRRDPLLTSQYHCDSHQRIVNDVRKVVSGKSRRLIATLQQYDVVHIVLMFDTTTDQINELDAPGWTIWRTKADCVRLSRFETTDHLSLCETPAARPLAVVAGVGLGRHLPFL